jgi:hypothetical protein
MAKKEIYQEHEHVPEPLPPAPEQDAWREVALFVCERCGKEKRGQKHLNMLCVDCHTAR